jgi:hypothetical protein
MTVARQSLVLVLLMGVSAVEIAETMSAEGVLHANEEVTGDAEKSGTWNLEFSGGLAPGSFGTSYGPWNKETCNQAVSKR